MTTTIDLSQLTAPDVIETLDFETLLAARKAAFVSLYPADQQAGIAATLALESEPLTRLLQENTYREMILRARYNDEARALILAQHNASCMVGETRTENRQSLSIPMASMEIHLPAADAENLQSQASAAGMPTARYLGIGTLMGAFGALHPQVQAFVDETKRDMNGGEE